VTFTQLLTRIARDYRRGDFMRAVEDIADRAWQNAHDTVYVEREAEPAELDRLGFATLEMLLADEPNRHVRAYFTRLGVSF
jgi:hypothetical protein